jgi:hypothetical protein
MYGDGDFFQTIYFKKGTSMFITRGVLGTILGFPFWWMMAKVPANRPVVRESGDSVVLGRPHSNHCALKG